MPAVSGETPVILDNWDEKRTLAEWIEKSTRTGRIDAVTGYFTIGAPAFISECLRDRIQGFRFVVGDIVSRAATSRR